MWYLATPNASSQNLHFTKGFQGFRVRFFHNSKHCFPNAFPTILSTISAIWLQKALNSTRFIRYFAMQFASLQNLVCTKGLEVLSVRVSPLWEPCFPNAFPMISNAISAFCIQKALHSTGFIRYSGKSGGHVPNAGNPNAFLSMPECPCSRAPCPGRAEISKIEGGPAPRIFRWTFGRSETHEFHRFCTGFRLGGMRCVE